MLKYGSANTFAYGCGRDFSEPGGPHQPNEFIACDDLVSFAKRIAVPQVINATTETVIIERK